MKQTYLSRLQRGGTDVVWYSVLRYFIVKALSVLPRIFHSVVEKPEATLRLEMLQGTIESGHFFGGALHLQCGSSWIDKFLQKYQCLVSKN